MMNIQMKNDDYTWLDSIIMESAIRGITDSLGPIDINWNMIGNFVFVLIQEYNGDWWYRIFDWCGGGQFHYERKRLLDPVEADDLKYLYGSFDNIYGGGRVIEHMLKGNWIQRLGRTLIENSK